VVPSYSIVGFFFVNAEVTSHVRTCPALASGVSRGSLRAYPVDKKIASPAFSTALCPMTVVGSDGVRSLPMPAAKIMPLSLRGGSRPRRPCFKMVDARSWNAMAIMIVYEMAGFLVQIDRRGRGRRRRGWRNSTSNGVLLEETRQPPPDCRTAYLLGIRPWQPRHAL